MSRKKKSNANWKGTGRRISAADWLRALGLIALIAAAACAAVFLLPSDAGDELPVVIRRVMTSNPSACFSVDGAYYDWIELQNISADDVSLAGWKITDSGDLRDAYVFGDIALSAGESLIVYCDDAPEGYDGGEIFTGFRLSADGEVLLLADPAQHIATVKVPAMGRTDVYQLDIDTGRYAAVSFREVVGADEAYARVLTPEFDPNGLTINELMPSNRATLADEDGDYSDWIELYNASAEPFDLSGCTLSDDDANRVKWAFPDVVLQPGEYLVMFASGKDRRDPNGELHASFRLSADGEALRLYDPEGEVITWVEYDGASADRSISRLPDGTMTAHLDPSPGYENTEAGARAFSTAMRDNAARLYINEVFSTGDGPDWVELYNDAGQAVDLTGYGLSDDPARPRKWQFPEGATIPAKSYVVIALQGSGKAEETEDELEAFDAEDASEAETPPPTAAPTPEASPTPAPDEAEPDVQTEADAQEGEAEGSAGADTTNAAADAVDASAEESVTASGVKPDYVADFALSDRETICVATPDGTVIDRVTLYDQYRDVSYGRAEGYGEYRYFADLTPGAANAAQSYGGKATEVTFSTPPGLVREKSIALEMYSDPGVRIYYTTDGSEPTPSSRVYSGPITMSANTCVKAVAWREDLIQSERVVASFIFAPHTVRLVCVTGDPSQLNGPRGTLNTGAKKDGYYVYVEMYEADGTKLVGQPCHLRLSGRSSRINYAQKAFKLTARRETGDTRFRAALFSNRDYDEYKSVVLRASGQDCLQTHMRDSILTSLAADTGVFYQETELCVVYVNGEYWGLYNMREHVDAHSIAQFEGWDDPDGVSIVEGSGSGAWASQGSSGHYHRMLEWVASNDMSLEENIEILSQGMDIENYLDYVLLQMYTCNQDLNNVRCYRSAAEDGRWKWVLFDLDLSYQIDRNNIKDWFSQSVGTITSQDATLFIALMRNEKVRDYFLTRAGELLATTLSAENVVGKIQERYALMQPEMTANCKRWGWKVETWTRFTKQIAGYAAARPMKMIGYMAETFRLSDAQVQQYFGAAIAKHSGN